MPDERIGQLIGDKYRLLEVLAVGGMGLVYAATHRETGRAVAIKLLRAELASQPDLVRRVSAEARLAVEASHPNVVEVLDAGADASGVPYLVLERLYGQPLDAVLGQPLSLLTTAQILVPVINALVVLHRAGIVHRDIKPGNIFLHRDGDGRITPKLLDFGIAKALNQGASTLSGVALGTPAYMAPEQALGRTAIGPASDVWSMGVVFVHCLTGRLPFAQLDPSARMRLRSVLSCDDLPGVADSVAELLVKALEFEPLERPASMQELRRALLLALHRADPTLDWPGELSVSYSPSQSDLAHLVGAPSNASAAASVLARPEYVLTRTLARPVTRRRFGQVLTAPARFALGVSVVAGVALMTYRGWVSAPSPTDVSDTASPMVASAAERSVEVKPVVQPPEAASAPASASFAVATGSSSEQSRKPSADSMGLRPSTHSSRVHDGVSARLAGSAASRTSAPARAGADTRLPSAWPAYSGGYPIGRERVSSPRSEAVPDAGPLRGSAFRLGANRSPIID